MTTVTKQFGKTCKYCGIYITWSDISRQFEENGERHLCSASSAKDRQLESDKRLNEMFADLKTEINNKFSDQVQRIDSLQKAQARGISLLTEIRAKVDGALRNYQ